MTTLQHNGTPEPLEALTLQGVVKVRDHLEEHRMVAFRQRTYFKACVTRMEDGIFADDRVLIVLDFKADIFVGQGKVEVKRGAKRGARPGSLKRRRL